MRLPLLVYDRAFELANKDKNKKQKIKDFCEQTSTYFQEIAIHSLALQLKVEVLSFFLCLRYPWLHSAKTLDLKVFFSLLNFFL